MSLIGIAPIETMATRALASLNFAVTIILLQPQIPEQRPMLSDKC